MKRNLNYLILITSICYFILIFIKNLVIPYPLGDESVFQRDLLLANSNSYSITISNNISIPYTYLTLIIFKIIRNSILALRLTNIILTIAVIFFLINSFKKIHSGEKLIYFVTYLFFFIGTVGYFFIGTNDALFYLGLIVLTIEVYLFLIHKGFNFLLVLVVLMISSATRSAIIIYIPLFIISMVFLFNQNFKKINIWILFAAPVFFIIILNIPNLLNHQGLSFDNKCPPKNYSNLNWTQRQYLSQLQVNNGNIPNKSHVSWAFVSDYLKINGENSLPCTMFESLYFDIKLTLKEFLKDLFDILFFSIRQLGFAILFILYQIYLIFINRLKYSFDQNLFTLMIVLLYILLFAFIIISFVELRWLCVPFVLSFFYFVDKGKISILFYNNIFLFLLMIFSFVQNNI